MRAWIACEESTLQRHRQLDDQGRAIQPDTNLSHIARMLSAVDQVGQNGLCVLNNDLHGWRVC
jgi:hypothetical protein